MNLRDTVKALEVKNIEVAVDLGDHQRCELDSNCPVAIQLRQVITEAKLSLPELLEAYATVTQRTEETPSPIPIKLEGVSWKTTLDLYGKRIDVDLTEVVKDQLDYKTRDVLDKIKGYKSKLERLGSGLYNSYLSEIERLRTSHTLSQYRFTDEELARYRVMVSEQDGNYAFCFTVNYNPLYLVRNSIRSAISPPDIAAIKREDCILKIIVTPQARVLGIIILTNTGAKLSHYHGRGGDCWGTVDTKIKSLSLREIERLKINVMGALATINVNSLMQHEPAGMPRVEDLLSRATEMGREGVIDTPASSTGEGESPGWVNTQARRGWGRRTE